MLSPEDEKALRELQKKLPPSRADRTRAAVRATQYVSYIQDLLNIVLKAGLRVDGVMGPATAAAIRRCLENPAEQIPAEDLEVMRVLLADPTWDSDSLPAAEQALPEARQEMEPGVWIFYATERSNAQWPRQLRIDDTIFWRHGSMLRGGAYHKHLRAGDSVILVVGQEIMAYGMLLAGDEVRFVDTMGRICRPVRVVMTHRAPVNRLQIEGSTGTKLIRHSGAVHPVSRAVVQALNETPSVGAIHRRYSAKSLGSMVKLPYQREWLGEALDFRPLVADLEVNAPNILPDAETAERLGWRGDIWRPPESAEGLHIEVEISDGIGTSESVEVVATEPRKPDIDARIPFVLDAPAEDRDQLDRGPFALFLAQRLQLIWCQMNGHAPDGKGGATRASPADSDTFIVHVDSPWGGGKTTFANFVAKVLDPRGSKLAPEHFLRSSLAPTDADEALADVPLDEVFVPPFAREDPVKWPGARRPWVVARYNAWRDQYVQPPWWQVFLAIQSEIAREVRRDAWEALRDGWLNGDPASYVRADETITRWGRAVVERLFYQMWNRKLKAQMLLLGVVAALVAAGGWLGAFDWIKGMSEPKKASEWITLATAVLGLGGASLAAVLTAVSQSLAPDLDFTAEHKQIGVEDPIGRFRRSFDRILRATDRPVLLIVDDLDRCEPRTVVELLRGFQTIVRSPRLFVLLLGDRAWIENAHDVIHKDVGGLHEGEGGLGARFVQKVIQLSFRLPTIKAEARTRFARGVLGDGPGDARTEEVAEVLRKVDAQVSEIVGQGDTLGGTEAKIALVLESARSELPQGLTDAETQEVAELAEKLASVKIVAASGADSAQQKSVFNAVTRLVESLPNNPRQIKRIFMAFATYEVVGRIYFGYRLTAGEGPEGELKARRWRQLAMWVTLAIEWPATWRAIARKPALLDVAYAEPAAARKKAEAALLKPLDEDGKKAARATLDKLREDRTLRALLSRSGAAALAGEQDDFARTEMEAEAVYEFNRIIWEPGFEIERAA